MTTLLTPRQIFRWHMAAIALLGVLNLIPILGDLTGTAEAMGPVYLIRLSAEGNLPTFFSTLALLTCGIVALMLSRHPALVRSERRGWMIAAPLFLVVAMDEQFILHEHLNKLADKLGATGVFHYVGPFPYLLVLIVLMPMLWRFFWDMSLPVRLGMVTGGFIYVSAALGMEVLEIPLRIEQIPETDIRRILLFAVEELGEMTGVAILLRTFLVRVAELHADYVFSIRNPHPANAMETASPIALAPLSGRNSTFH